MAGEANLEVGASNRLRNQRTFGNSHRSSSKRFPRLQARVAAVAGSRFDELLAAINVVRCAGDRRIGHEIQVRVKDGLRALGIIAVMTGHLLKPKVRESGRLRQKARVPEACCGMAPTIGEYGTIDETFSPTALAVMSEWIGRHAI